MIVVVTGSRTYSDREFLFTTLSTAHARNPIRKLVLGDAKGADALAKEWAVANDVPFIVHKAHWNRQPDGSYDRSAGHKRNERMIEYALDKQASLNAASLNDSHRIYVVAFTDKPLEESKGTYGCVKYAQKRTMASIVHFFSHPLGGTTRTVVQDYPR